ncbi:Peroxisome biosynthesis protein pex1 [Rhodotorula sphaerocarpa]
MGKPATLHFTPLRNCLANLPLALHAPLVQRGIAPQSVAIQLTFQHEGRTNKAVLGWTGLPASVAPPPVGRNNSATSAAADRIEIDPQFAAMLGLGLEEGTKVNVEMLRDLPHATTVNVTPSSADDWEVLESNAEFVEMYLLNQVRAVKVGMQVGCWVGATLIRFDVDSTSPDTDSPLMLSSATELIVAPRSRHPPRPDIPVIPDLSATPSARGVTSAAAAEWEQIRKHLLRLLPASKPPARVADAAVARHNAIYVSPGVHDIVRRAFPGDTKITLSHYPRPVSRHSASASQAPPPDSASHGKTADDEQAGASGEQAPPAQQQRSSVEVHIEASSDVPPAHVWVPAELRRELGIKDGKEFELVKLGPPLSSAARKARQKEKDNAQAPPLSPTSTSGTRALRGKGASGSHSSSLESRGAEARASPASAPDVPAPAKRKPTPPLAGVDAHVAKLRAHVHHSLASLAMNPHSSATGVFVTGSSGAGKTALVQSVANELSQDPQVLAYPLYIDCAKHADERMPALKGRMRDWFDEACWHAPTVLVLDNLDRMIPAEVEHADSFPAVHLANTFLSLATAALSSRPIILVASAQSSVSLHPLLSSTHLLGETISLRGPDKRARRDILRTLVEAKAGSSNLQITPTLDYAAVAATTEGYLPADLRDLADRAVQQAAIRSLSERAAPAALTLTPEDFSTAQQGFVPLSLRDVKLQKSEVQWADIGGLVEARKTLRETLEWPTKYGAIFASCPLRLRSGILLYGYPGCGKTLLASAVAKECGLNFISVKGPEILNKYIGASEKSVRDLFERAQAAKPCILFFDEFDSIAPKRGHDSTGVTDRVVNQMLTQMDGAEGLDGVYVLAATSRPDLIDPALLRPGRLDKSVLCDMPSRSDRIEIMQSAARKISLMSSVNLEAYAEETAGYSGADLQAFVYNAHLDAIHETLTSAVDASGRVSSSTAQEDQEVQYAVVGAIEDEKVLSRAERADMDKRLEQILSAMRASSGSRKPKQSKGSAIATPASKEPTYVEDRHLRQSLQSTRPSVPDEELVRLRRMWVPQIFSHCHVT